MPLFIHALQCQVSVLALIVPADLFFVHLIMLRFGLQMGLMPDELVPLIVHVPVLVLVYILDVDRSILGLNLHQLLMSVLDLRYDQSPYHLFL